MVIYIQKLQFYLRSFLISADGRLYRVLSRQVLIQPISENVEKIHDLFESMSQAVMILTEQ